MQSTIERGVAWNSNNLPSFKTKWVIDFVPKIYKCMQKSDRKFVFLKKPV